MSEMLPDGWAETTLEQLVSDVAYGYTASASSKAGTTRMLRITDIQAGRVDWCAVPSCDISAADIPKYLLHEGDLVFARTGATVGKSFLIRGNIPQAVFASYLIRIRPLLPEMKDYLAHFFKSPLYWNQISDLSVGTGQPNVNGTKLKGLTIPLPPINEQKRIADKLDVLLGRVDACRERLKNISPLMNRFRQSVLLSAVGGRLTEDWRCARGLSFDSWVEVTLGEIVTQLKNGLSPKPHETPPGIPILRISSVRPFVVNFGDLRYLRNCDQATTSDYLLEPGDLLFTRYNGSLEFVGVCAMIRQSEVDQLVYPDKLIRVRVDHSRITPAFLELTMNSPKMRREIESLAKTTSGQTGISGKDLKSLKFRLPPLAEQELIVKKVSHLLMLADKEERRAIGAARSLSQLVPAILAKAFRGDLVPQDPSDESASELLERIQKTSGEVMIRSKPKAPKKERALVSK